IDADARMLDLVVGVQHLAVGVGDAALAEHPGHVLAAAVAEIGEQFHQFHVRTPRASITLKPSCTASARTSAKRAASKASYGRWRFATISRRPRAVSASAALAMKARPSSGRSARPRWNGGLLTMTS